MTRFTRLIDRIVLAIDLGPPPRAYDPERRKVIDQELANVTDWLAEEDEDPQKNAA